jgi:predicted transcriptional regulator of viral defense system
MNDIKPTELVKTAMRYPQITAIQKLGYLLERQLDNPKLAEALLKVLNNKNFFQVPLVSHKNKQGPMDEKWKVIINTKIESDL